MWRPPVKSQEHGLVHPVGDEKEYERQAVHGEEAAGVGHRHKEQREEVRVPRLRYRAGGREYEKEKAARDTKEQNKLSTVVGESYWTPWWSVWPWVSPFSMPWAMLLLWPIN